MKTCWLSGCRWNSMVECRLRDGVSRLVSNSTFYCVVWVQMSVSWVASNVAGIYSAFNQPGGWGVRELARGVCQYGTPALAENHMPTFSHVVRVRQRFPDLSLSYFSDTMHYRFCALFFLLHIDGLVQERRTSSVLAMELRLSSTNPWILREQQTHERAKCEI